MQEIWKDVLGYEGIYQVSDAGNVKSLDRVIIGRDKSKRFVKGVMKKTTKKPNGYLQINLKYRGYNKKYYIHRLVANAFLDNAECKETVNHKNGIRDDNRLENLEWATLSENHKHSFDVLKRRPNRRLFNKMDIENILDMYFNKKLQGVKIAKKYNVCAQTIYNIVNNRTYKNIERD